MNDLPYGLKVSVPIDTLKRKLALENAVTLRTCPPDHLLFPKPSKKAKTHIMVCEHCRERVELFNTSKSEVPKFSPAKIKSLVLERACHEGLLVPLKKQLSGWLDYEYINAPTVLLLQEIPTVKLSKGWRVVQTYVDQTLMGPNDIPIGKSILSGFCEPWNCYSVPEEFLDLSAPIQEVPAHVLKQAQKLASYLEAEFEEVQRESVLYYFRVLELKVGSFFARKAVDFFLNQDIRRIQFLTELIAKTFGKSIVVSDQFDPYVFLETVKVPMLEYQLAASTEEGWEELRLVSIFRNEIKITLSQYRLTLQQVLPQGLLVVGVLREPVVGKTEIKGWWQASEDEWIESAEAEMDSSNQQFRLFFTAHTKERFRSGTLRVLIVTYE